MGEKIMALDSKKYGTEYREKNRDAIRQAQEAERETRKKRASLASLRLDLVGKYGNSSIDELLAAQGRADGVSAEIIAALIIIKERRRGRTFGMGRFTGGK
jgi:hypothetical protein